MQTFKYANQSTSQVDLKKFTLKVFNILLLADHFLQVLARVDGEHAPIVLLLWIRCHYRTDLFAAALGHHCLCVFEDGLGEARVLDGALG